MFAPRVATTQTRGDAGSTGRFGQRTSRQAGNERDGDHEREIVGESLTDLPAPRHLAWDFGKIPLFPPDRTSRTKASHPLPGIIQPKLVVGAVNDPLEHEADRVADQVMRMPAAAAGLSLTAAPPQVSRKCAACEEEAQPLQPKMLEPSAVPSRGEPGVVQDALHTPDQPLDPESRAFFEPRFGRDFSKVRIHADSEAARGAQDIQARAYTLGRDIVFGAGEYTPLTKEGRRLIAHELAHVVQQEGGFATDHLSGAAIRRQPFTKPTKHTVTQDEVVQTMTGLGGPHKDTAAWEATMQSATFLGHGIGRGVRQEFKTMLATAETKVNEEYKKSGNTPPHGHGIKSIGGYRREISPHGSEVAIDIDGNNNPYILHENVPNSTDERTSRNRHGGGEEE